MLGDEERGDARVCAHDDTGGKDWNQRQRQRQRQRQCEDMRRRAMISEDKFYGLTESADETSTSMET